jgi:RNA polymerase sigma-70 factor (ECF subfamily)
MDFEEIYKTYWQKIFRLCMGYVNDHDWAKDIAQETFITVWKKLPEFRNESSVGTWVFRIASNQCLRQIEKQKRMPRTNLPIDLEETISVNSEPKFDFLYQCIAELPEIDRLIISLELEDIKQAEIASIVGISDANVRVKIHRIKEKLTQKFEKYEH